MSASDWSSFRDQLGAELESARSEVERLSAALAEVEAGTELIDAEAETLRMLAEIRAAIAGEVQSSAGVEAVRSALLRLFERFIVRVELDTREGRIKAVVRSEAQNVEGEETRPVLRPTALELGRRRETQSLRASCFSADLFAPISFLSRVVVVARRHWLYRIAEDPNDVVVAIQFSSQLQGRAFLENAGVREAMRRAGVEGEPRVHFGELLEVVDY